MKEKLDALKNEVETKVSEMHIIVSNIKYYQDGKYNILEIELDAINGLDLDTIVEATNVINPIVDKMDIIDDEYILDVISKEKGDING